MKHKIQVVMLPTEDTTHLFISHSQGLPAYNERHWVMSTGQHLYITVSQDVEPIKEGDWYYWDDSYMSNSVGQQEICIKSDEKTDEHCRKIIATTDPKLTFSHTISGYSHEFKKPIPQVQQSFLKEYVSNPEGEWEVEYEFKRVECYNYNGDHIGKSCSCKSGDFRDVYELKLNQDNTVNITSVEEKMYSRKEVESILFQYAEDEHAWFSCKSEVDSFNNWIKENL